MAPIPSYSQQEPVEETSNVHRGVDPDLGEENNDESEDVVEPVEEVEKVQYVCKLCSLPHSSIINHNWHIRTALLQKKAELGEKRAQKRQKWTEARKKKLPVN